PSSSTACRCRPTGWAMASSTAPSSRRSRRSSPCWSSPASPFSIWARHCAGTTGWGSAALWLPHSLCSKHSPPRTEDVLPLALRLCLIATVGAIALWLCVVAALWLFQRQLLYMAPHNPPGLPPLGYSAVLLTTEDGLRLTAWYRPAQAGRPTIVFYSAQGANLAFSAEWTQGFASAG